MAAGLGPGKYDLWGQKVIVEANIPEVFQNSIQENNYVAKLSDGASFAGSVATMDQLVRNMVKLATLNPAKMQRLDHEIGVLAKGMRSSI